MKYMVALLILTLNLLACTGDCMTCHPNLLPTIHEDERHKPMLTCINCHSADPSSMAECGDDCFSCHPMSKINRVKVKEHEVIQGCRDCHVGQNEKLFDTTTPFDQSSGDSLKDFLIK